MMGAGMIDAVDTTRTLIQTVGEVPLPLTSENATDLIQMLTMTAHYATDGLASATNVPFEFALQTVLEFVSREFAAAPTPNWRLIVTPED
jgi:hypothetical protein